MVVMGRLHIDILGAIAADRYVIGVHADGRLRERRIPAWQVIASANEGGLLLERADARPNPVVEIEQILPDGTTVKVVWAWLMPDRTAKLVTVHFFNQ